MTGTEIFRECPSAEGVHEVREFEIRLIESKGDEPDWKDFGPVKKRACVYCGVFDAFIEEGEED